ncbi:hypothetical protein B0A50_06396 [Salinomyces thailandicus]|uniref:Uncharacterized protein n=1 Tax=Salinomyces thailandicus TaxID=706561 RepID=A0A4U0TRT9_9PEZI|nr:hypothetical protein B0A50_06396 [Salinomyces thailandica]
MAPAKGDSHLRDLTPELRNIIYFYALVSDEPLTIPKSGKLEKPALLHASREIAAEASPIYYSQNSFVACAEDDMEGIVRWVARVKAAQRKYISSLTVDGATIEAHREPQLGFAKCVEEFIIPKEPAYRFAYMIANNISALTQTCDCSFLLLCVLGVRVDSVSFRVPGRTPLRSLVDRIKQLCEAHWLRSLNKTRSNLATGRWRSVASPDPQSQLRVGFSLPCLRRQGFQGKRWRPTTADRVATNLRALRNNGHTEERAVMVMLDQKRKEAREQHSDQHEPMDQAGT